MKSRLKKIVLVVAVIAFGFVTWLVVDLRKAVSADLRQFDPEEIARLDTQMWRSYYDKQRLKLFGELAELLRRQYHMPPLRSYVVAFHAAKAAFVFKDGSSRSDYERALPDLLDYYAAIRKVSTTPFDVDRAARLELEWWIVHRERKTRPSGDLDRALADLAAEVYQMPASRFAEHARYRAEAMVIRDDSAERNGPGGLSDAEWEHIHDLLRRSWMSLWRAVNETQNLSYGSAP